MKKCFELIEVLMVASIIMLLIAIIALGYYEAKEKYNSEKEINKKVEQINKNSLSVIKYYCTKCGNNTIGIKYIKKYDKEYLNISCKRCQYVWKTICFYDLKTIRKDDATNEIIIIK